MNEHLFPNPSAPWHPDPSRAPRAGASLDALETPEHETTEDLLPRIKLPGPRDTLHSRHDPALHLHLRHSGWARARANVAAAMSTLELPAARRFRFDDCGTNAWVLTRTDEPGQYRIACNRCRDRWCLACGRERSRVIAANVRHLLPDSPVRFVTFTLQHTNDPLTTQLSRLYRAFRDLRRVAFWRERVDAGVSFLEVKVSANDGLWHPHLHCLIIGKYLPQGHLRQIWHGLTGGSHVVDVRLVKDHGKAIEYISKYASKPLDNSILKDQTRLVEAMAAMHSRRLIIAFGGWHHAKLSQETLEGDWVPLAPLHDVYSRAARGHPCELAILSSLGLRPPATSGARPPPSLPSAESSGAYEEALPF